jgi:hypothetical protein
MPNHAGLLIVGDIDQLASAGPGQVLADVVRLTRGLPSGSAKPDHHRCPSDQSRNHAGSDWGDPQVSERVIASSGYRMPRRDHVEHFWQMG